MFLKLKPALNDLLVRPSKSYLPFFDGLRTIAAFWVFCFHFLFGLNIYVYGPEFTAYILNPFIKIGALGHLAVDLFFVISGFLIGRILFTQIQDKSEIDLNSFYRNRFFRIVPTSYSFIIVCLFFSYFVVNTDPELLHYARYNFLFLQNYLPWNSSYLPWTWSLAVEEHFYILAPLLFLIFRKKPKHLFYGLLFLFNLSFYLRWMSNTDTLISLFPKQDPLTAQNYFNSLHAKSHLRFGGLMVGLILSYLHTFHFKDLKILLQSSKNSYLLLFFSLSLLFASIWPQLQDRPTYTTWYLVAHSGLFALGVAGLILLILAEAPQMFRIKAVLSHAYTYPMAQLSFSFFLYSLATIHWVFYLCFDSTTNGFKIALPWIFIISFIMTGLQSLLTYFFVEYPMRKWRTSSVQRFN